MGGSEEQAESNHAGEVKNQAEVEAEVESRGKATVAFHKDSGTA